MSKEKNTLPIPKDGWEGLKENFIPDLTSGFVVFLLALPLSLGIAQASAFPPVMGLVSAIIGGLVATFFAGSKLTIKGPAAGLIVIIAGAVAEFGGGEQGWHLALGVMVVAGLVQILFGVFKWGKLVDFFPLSAVHGMLAAIGLIIIAKQIPVLLNVDSALTKGKGPLELFASIPEFFANLDPQVSIIGGISLAIMLGWNLVTHKKLKQIPAPLLVLIFAIPAGIYMNLATDAPSALVKVGNLIEKVGYNADFSGFSQIAIFIKYVIMVALVGSLESLLTVKAIDMVDPYKRKSDPNKDIIAVGIANTLSALVGGLPMISEVARSSANVAQGGKTRWANFFHGVFLLIFALFAYTLLEKIPNAALAAMLIAVGIKLAHPKEFIHTYRIGAEQLAIFMTTIFFTLFEDLLVGIAAGILLKIVIHLFRGASLKTLFKAMNELIIDGDNITLKIGEAALFTNYLGLKKQLDAIPNGKNLTIEITGTKIIDHSVMENLHHFHDDYEAAGGIVHFVGLDNLEPVSKHPLAARKLNKKGQSRITSSNDLPPIPFDEKHVLHELTHYLPAQLALKDFVHHNSLHAFQDKEFFEGIFAASKIFGIQPTFNINEYRKLYAQGRIKPEILNYIILKHKSRNELDNFRQKMLQATLKQEYNPRIGTLRAFWKKDYELDLDNLVQPLLFRILGGYLDQGIALWHFPFEDKGLINSIKTLEENSFTSFFKSKKTIELLFSEDLSIEKMLQIVVGNSNYYENYLFDQQFSHKGWSGLVASIEGTPETLLYQKNIELKDLIILELLLEFDALDNALGQNWKPLAVNIDIAPQDYFAKAEKTELEEVLQIWHEAFEWDYYDMVLSGVSHLAAKPRIKNTEKKSFQAMFCIDDREDSIRRQIELSDPNAETFGAPGFFGAAIYFQPFGGKFYEKNCPAPTTPKHLIKEIDVLKRKEVSIFHHKNTHTFFRGFLYALSLGLVASGRMLLDLFRPKMRADVANAFAHMDADGKLQVECEDPNHRENGLQVGFLKPEMADIVFNLLSGIGLTDNFSDIIYVIAHGSTTSNNPHYNAYNCGACNGRPGSPNARAFAYMANNPEVRKLIKAKGMDIPETTQFVAGLHDTSSDEIGYYDVTVLTEKNHQAHIKNVANIENALDHNSKERARRFASVDMKKDIKKIRADIKKRSLSYFEPRPELNHGSNALCYVGSRSRMKGLFLDRRAFLQSYNYENDLNGDLLTQVLAPLPTVCGGINLEYYFSRIDNEKMGAGTKLPHNVLGLIAVVNSSDGDLRSGLHLQTVENHDPVRLMMMIEHHPEVVLKVISASKEMYDWFDKGWIHLVAVSPEDGRLYHFKNGKFESYEPLTKVVETDDIRKVIENAAEMKTNHILEATKENIPVHVYTTV
jgi:hypothetical protein